MDLGSTPNPSKTFPQISQQKSALFTFHYLLNCGVLTDDHELSDEVRLLHL